MKDPGRLLISATLFLLGIYYLLIGLYFVGGDTLQSVLEGFYRFVSDEFLLMNALEIIALVSLFVDVVLLYDKLSPMKRTLQLVLGIIYTIAFSAKLIAFWFGYAFW